MADESITLTVFERDGEKSFHSVLIGSNLREVILALGFSPYQGKFKNLNCKGMGVCGTCKVLVREGDQDWDRRSCQIQCFQDLEIRLK